MHGAQAMVQNSSVSAGRKSGHFINRFLDKYRGKQMKKYESYARVLPWFMALVLSVLLAACGGGRDPILGAGGIGALVPPTVTAVTPGINAVAVSISNPIITATFSEPVAPIAGGASFAVTCAAPCVSPTGTVSLDATRQIATFTLTPATSLVALSTYTAAVTGATSVATGLALATPKVWQFTTTGVALDTTRPTVLTTNPVKTTPGPTINVPTNAAITAVFNEDMAPATIVSPATSFTLACAAPCTTPAPIGSVSYTNGTATFKPAVALEASTTYTATIKGTGVSPVKDLAGNALAGNPAFPAAANDYVWTFTTAAGVAPVGNPAVNPLTTSPTASATGVCPSASINATFTVPSGLRMDPSTINAINFVVTGPAVTPVVATSVLLDGATGRIATFTPSVALTNGVTYTATIKGGATGVKDLAIPANAMAADYIWTFTAGPATGNCLAPVALNAASKFGTFGGTAGMTNTGILTIVNGDIGSIATGTSMVTGFHDLAGDIYTETPANIGAVNGKIYTCTNSVTGPTSTGPNAASCSIATQARLDAQAAYLALAAMPAGANPGANLANLTLAPGVYTSPSGSFLIEGGDLTLDAQGNANAVWVFQMATTLTVGGPGAAAPQSIILAGGAQAKNVFWQVGSFATINAAGGGTMVGNIIAQEGASFSTVGNVNILTLNGRALSLGASVTLVDTVINVPTP